MNAKYSRIYYYFYITSIFILTSCLAIDKKILRLSSKFPDSESNQYYWTNVAVNSQNIYAGTTNQIFNFDSSLAVSASVVTNQVTSDNLLVSNVNKVLVINGSTLITCGTHYNGTCQIRDINTLNIILSSDVYVATSDPISPSIAFIGPGSKSIDYLYIGNSNIFFNKGSSLDGEYYRRINYTLGFSSRDMNFFLTQNEKSPQGDDLLSAVYIDLAKAITYSNNYIHGFFVDYFVFTVFKQLILNNQTKSLLSSINYNSGFSSYVETPLNCSSQNYIVTLATISKQNTTNLDLYTIFTDGVNNVLCVFKINEIKKNIEKHSQCSHPYYYRFPIPIECSSTMNGSVIAMPNLKISSILSFFDEFNILFLGTTDGKVFKVVLKDDSVMIIDEILVARQPINSLTLIPQAQSFIALTSNQLFKIAFANCDNFLTCNDCIFAGDPQCGWCVLMGRCTLKSSCPNSRLIYQWVRQSNWTTVNPSGCPAVKSIQNLRINSNKNALITVNYLPQLPNNKKWMCFFNSTLPLVEATNTTDTLSCLPPSNAFTVGNSSLEIRVDDISIMNGSFRFFDCSQFKSCESCGSTGDCFWCYQTNDCLPSESAGCIKPKNDSCPQISNDYSRFIKPINIPTSLEIPLKFRPKNANSDFKCLDNTVNKSYIGRLQNESVTCDNVVLFSSNELTNISFSVLWNNFAWDGVYYIGAYNCTARTSSDCSLCRSWSMEASSNVYNCNWCNDRCIYSTCPSPSACPLPVITSVMPKFGPKDGGTSVYISGSNIGFKVDSVSVSIGGKECQAVRDLYTISTRYVCKSPSSNNAGLQNILLKVEDKFTQSDVPQFRYTNPTLSINTLSPRSGIEAGGTVLTVSGSDLMVPDYNTTYVTFNNQRISLYANLSNASQIAFLSPPKENQPTNVSIVTLNMDNAIISTKIIFKYVNDPRVTGIETGIESNVYGSIASGGCVVKFTGDGFSRGSNRQVIFNSSTVSLEASIIDANDTTLSFLSPIIPKDAQNLIMQLSIDYWKNELINWISLEDPAVFNHTIDGRFVTIKGSNFRNICGVPYILINSLVCDVQPRKKPDEIVCEIPADMESLSYKLNITIGKYMYIREINSPSPPGPIGNNLLPIILGIIFGFIVILIAIITIVFACKYHSKKMENKNLMSKIDTIERNYSRECRDAFTQLQTGISHYEQCSRSSSLPFRSYPLFILHVLFDSNDTNHKILHPTRKVCEISKKMQRFHQLLNYKSFFESYVETLEQQSIFTPEEKAKVAAYLTIVLLDKMDYATELIQVLMEKLIANEQSAERNPKVMLRGNSISEKLLGYWLTVSMYSYLKGPVGINFFMLYNAIKFQTEKGPIDAITDDAKFTLSEAHLLRDMITDAVQEMEITVIDTNGKKMPCSFLNCDTIGQAKRKILDTFYRVAPIGQRPSDAAVNLHLMLDETQWKLLLDEDNSSVVEDGWKRLNTLKHYQVKDSDTFKFTFITENEDPQMSSLMISLRTMRNGSSQKNESHVFHLVKNDNCNRQTSTLKFVSEALLSRLIQTKMLLDQYICEFISLVFKATSDLPPTVKYLFDLLDKVATVHAVNDQDTLIIWKNNSYYLRCWMNLIQNPDYLFDIRNNNVVNHCLTVVAEAVIDSCSVQDIKCDNNSSTSKLLFYRDHTKYKKMHRSFYSTIRQQTTISNEQMNFLMQNSMQDIDFNTDLNLEHALETIYFYAEKFATKLYDNLNANPTAKKFSLPKRFNSLLYNLDLED